MRKLSLWLRARPIVGDSLVVALLLLLEVMYAAPAGSGTITYLHYVPTIALQLLPLAFRRRAPLLATHLVLLGGFLQLVAQPSPMVRPSNLALGISLYTLVVYRNRRSALLYACPLVLGTLLWAYWRLGTVLGVIMPLLTFALCWTLGEFAGARRAYHAEVEHRLRDLEFEQDQQARIAVAEERNRIARELHDVLAHSVSVMVTHADGAGFALRDKPELAEQALHTISGTGRQALNELRGLLEVLRSPDEEGQPRTPKPGAAGLHELVARVRDLGLPVTLELEGDLEALPVGPGLGVYRIVQESLTNTIKHAGWRARSRVRVRNDGHRIDIEVTDDGGPGLLPPLASGGNGIIGMRERAHLYGGTLEAGPGPEGGWRVHCALPVPHTGTPLAAG